ncbi:MAG TPA: hypothetical protein VHQ41_03350 [Patescibacteria group bacterium]|nr:hypothetical protein [Patescibacteria group bacterium]
MLLAQNLPSNTTPIQRTIEEVNPGDSTQANPLTTQTSTSPASASSGKQVVFGLAAALLVVIAVVAIVVLWKDRG